MKDEKKISQIKDKLKKLMKKEESSRSLGNLAEAEAFAAKIQQLLMDYEIEMSEINTEEHSFNLNEEFVDCGELTNRHESSWVLYLYDACASTNFCKILVQGKISGLKISIIGEETHREFLHYMVHQLVPRLRQLARSSFRDYSGPDKRNTYIRSFLRGASKGIKDKLLSEMAKQREETSKVDAIVLDKQGKLSTFLKEKYPHGLGTVKSRQSSSEAGYYRGKAAGRNINITKGVKHRGMGGQKLLG